MRLINRDELNERLTETLERMKSKGVEPTWDDAMYVIDMVDDAHEERRMKKWLLDKIKHRRFCKLNNYNCPDCIYHDFVFDGAIFRGNRCRWPERKEDDIRNQPTVEAIPVEWIEKYIWSADTHEEKRALRKMYLAWEKENEQVN